MLHRSARTLHSAAIPIMDKNALLAVFRDASNSGWSLRSDVQLQDWLEGFADHVKQRTESVIKEVEKLGTGAGEVELYLQNTSNSLRALSATQFIENCVDEADDMPISKVEPPAKEPRGENYETQIIPCYKEAVLTAWNAYEGFSSSKTRSSSMDVNNELARGPLATQRPKLPHIIGTDEFVRDSRCGLADTGFPIKNRGSSSSEPAETDSDTDKEETRLAAELVGGGLWLEDEWSATGSETSHHQQGGVLEPAVSAALDFKAMLEAALRGPSFPYEEGMLPNMENVYGQYSYMDNAPTSSAHEKMSNTSRMRSETGERELGGALPTTLEPAVSDTQRNGSYLVNNMEFQDFEMERASPSNDSEYKTAAASSEQSTSNQNQAGNLTSSYHGSSLDPVHPYGDTSMRREQGPYTTGASKTHTPPAPNFMAPFRSNEINPQPPPLKLQAGVVTDSPAIPTLPDGLFQGLQAAIQAREKRSQSQNNEGTTDKEGLLQKPNVSGKERTTVSMENRIAGRKSNLKDNRLLNRNNTNETSLKSQKGLLKGVNSGLGSKPQKTISFQGGLFDDDDNDDDDLDNRVDVPKSGNDSEDKNGGFVKPIVDSQSHFTGPQSSNFSSNKQGLLDDISQISTSSSTQDVYIGKRPPALISSEEDSKEDYEGHDITHATTNCKNIVEDQVDSGKDADVKSQRTNSQKLAVAVAAIREPIPSESSDTSLSWSDSGSGESSSENERSILKSAGKQKIESSEARIDTVHQQSRLSGSSRKSDDGGKTTKVYQAKPTLGTTEEAREPAMNVSRPFVQTASDLPNTKGSPSLQLRTEADPSVSCMFDGAATMGRPHQGVTEVNSSLMHYSSGRLQQDAPGTKEHQGDHSSSLSAVRNGVSNTSKLGEEATLASTQSPTQGGAGKDDKTPFSGVPTITSRRYRSLFDDDDDEEEDFILSQSRGLLATESRIGASRSSTSFSSDRRQNSPPVSPNAPGRATTTTSIHRRVFSESRSEISSQRPQSASSPLSRVLNRSVSSPRNSEVAVSSPSPSIQEQARTAKASPRTVSALLFGDDDNSGEDSLFGPLGGRSQNKSSGLFDVEDTSEGDSFLQNVSAKLPLTSSLKASRPVDSSSERIPRRSLFGDDGDNDNDDAI